MECYNCQKFGHVWANCKQPPRFLWCGGGHMHRDCPEKQNASSTRVLQLPAGGRRESTSRQLPQL
jgi:hypothetical protein